MAELTPNIYGPTDEHTQDMHVDGVRLVPGDKILFTTQKKASENGIYIARAGSWGAPKAVTLERLPLQNRAQRRAAAAIARKNNKKRQRP